MPEQSSGPHPENESISAPFDNLSSDQAQEVANEVKPLEDEAAGLEDKKKLLSHARKVTLEASVEKQRQQNERLGTDALITTAHPSAADEVVNKENVRSNLLHKASDIVAEEKAEEILQRDGDEG